MIGAIIGDIAGSAYEHQEAKPKNIVFFEKGSHFSDDSVLTIAVADALLHGKSYADCYKFWGRKYPDAGYGKMFKEWLFSDNTEGQSFGNGAAMRVSPVAYWHKTLEGVLKEAEKSAAVTHKHPEAIKGAQAVAAAIFMARTGASKAEIKNYVAQQFEYDLNFSLQHLIDTYTFDSTAPGSVPQAIFSFLESKDYEEAVRIAISIGGDTDTIACMAGSIAEAYYKSIPDVMIQEAFKILPPEVVKIVNEFRALVLNK